MKLNTIKFFLLLVLIPLLGASQGLQFKSNESLIAERTSYEVFARDQPVFNKNFKISFYLSISDIDSFGNIFSIRDKNQTDSYSLFYQPYDDQSVQLKFNLDGVKKLNTILIKKELLGNKHWVHASFQFNSIEKKISIRVNDTLVVSENYEFPERFTPEIFFGKHHSIIDVPSFSIKNLVIENGEKEFQFQLNESTGSKVHTTSGEVIGQVQNPVWLINDSYHWKKIYSQKFNKVTALNFNKEKEQFYMVGDTLLSVYEPITRKKITNTYNEPLPVPMKLGMSFIDPKENKIFIYEVNDIPIEAPSIASLSLDLLEWEIESYQQLEFQRHHHNTMFLPNTREFVIFGGFGNQRLNNQFHSFNLETKKWNLKEMQGDIIFPRYFSGLLKKNDHKAIIYGGIGNYDGDQSLGKRYFNDIYEVDFSKNEIHKLLEISAEQSTNVSSRDMVFSKDSTSFYTLKYPEYKHSSSLQLYEYSLQNGSYKALGDSIPIISERIRTNANLYLNKARNQLYCAVQEFELDGSNHIKIYSLDYPPVSKNMLAQIDYKGTKTNNQILIWTICAGILLLILWFVLLKWRKKKKDFKGQLVELDEYKKVAEEIPNNTNAVYLFGNMTAYNEQGKDITYLFSPKLKQLFLLILVNSLDKSTPGISSESIYNSIWPDKDQRKAKNLKNVAINQLRKILVEIQGIEICYEEKHFYIDWKPPFYCDYFEFISQLNEFKHDGENTSLSEKLIETGKRGKFLNSINDENFDEYKTKYELQVLEIIPSQVKTYFKQKNYSKVILLSKILFNLDPLNKLAFYYSIHAYVKLDLNNKAKQVYTRYILELQKTLNEDFPFTFKEVSAKIPNQLQ